MTSGTTGRTVRTAGGCPGRTTALRGGGSSWLALSPAAVGVLVSLGLWATRVVVLYSHLFVGASGCPGGGGALRMFLRRLARSQGPLLGSNCGVDFVMAALQPRDPARWGSRASSRRTHKSGRDR